ncbi:MAG TPA: diacylglycerol kinase family protein [Pyrinomonadaceae bacterium]|nr:diacylglycerol kinase family protein [Pyrinomonadaceae bacterium]
MSYDGYVKAEVIINSASGTTTPEELLRDIKQMFAAEGVDAQIHHAGLGDDINQLARRAANTDAEIIVAGGGDGTLNSVASAALASNKILGVLPLGTLNHFAKDLQIPLDIKEAVKTIAYGRTIRVDVGEFNGRIFLNNSSLGLYPSIVREREKQQRLGYRKWPAYVWAALAVLMRYPFLDLRLQAEGKELATRTPFLFVGNNRYEMETLNIGGRSALDAGTLSLYLTHRTGRLGLLRLAWRALFGGLNQEKDFMALSTEELSIETRKKRVRVAMDGEVTVVQPPLRYRIRKKALAVRVPRGT